MTPRCHVLTRSLLAVALALVPLGAAAAKKAPPPPTPPCVKVTTEVRYANYGYDHIVTIANSCEKTAACVVRTDANPDPISVSVKARETEELVTFRGSPAYEFKADVRCKLVD